MENENSKTTKNCINESNKVLCMTFNQDCSLIGIGTETGFKIINSVPFKDEHFREIDGGVALLAMLNRSNILAFVGEGKNTKYPNTKLVIWDEEQGEAISEINFATKILNIKMKTGRIFVVCQEKIFIFDFDTLNLIDSIETNNTRGLLAIAIKENIIAFPIKNSIGCVRIKNYDKSNETMIHAHKKDISWIELNKDGSIIVTASLKGTFIRIFNTTNNNLIQEVRRGKEPAEIFSISLNSNDKYFVVSSDRPTLHVFCINNSSENMTKENIEDFNKSIFGGNIFDTRKRFLSSSYRSFAKYRVDSQKSISVFGPNNIIILITREGNYSQLNFDSINGGDCLKSEEKNF